MKIVTRDETKWRYDRWNFEMERGEEYKTLAYV